jgi:hypothetical protein
MEKNRESLVKWTLEKAKEYLESAKDNLVKNRLFPCAEDIFKAVETLLETLLYYHGVKKIEYPGLTKEFKGRLALQFLVRDILLLRKRIDRSILIGIWLLLQNCTLLAINQQKLLKNPNLKSILSLQKICFSR